MEKIKQKAKVVLLLGVLGCVLSSPAIHTTHHGQGHDDILSAVNKTLRVHTPAPILFDRRKGELF